MCDEIILFSLIVYTILESLGGKDFFFFFQDWK